MSSILKISEAATMGIHAVSFLANCEDSPTATKAIANTLACSEAHLAKVLQRLTKVGLLSATRGPRGGFVLRKPGNETSMLEVLEAIDGELSSSECMFESDHFCGDECLSGSFLRSINDQVREYFATTSMDGVDCATWFQSMVEKGRVTA